MPLDMVDTCLCMGAGVNIAQGIGAVTPGMKCFAFVGDSTFFASALTGVVNGVYNQADMTLVVLDNSTTAMTGHQPHPGTGHTMMGQVVDRVSIEDSLRGVGVQTVRTVDPLDLPKAIAVVREVAAEPGLKAIIFRSPCIAIVKPLGMAGILQDKCRKCKKCIREIGCPGIVIEDGRVTIELRSVQAAASAVKSVRLMPSAWKRLEQRKSRKGARHDAEEYPFDGRGRPGNGTRVEAHRGSCYAEGTASHEC